MSNEIQRGRVPLVTDASGNVIGFLRKDGTPEYFVLPVRDGSGVVTGFQVNGVTVFTLPV